MSVILPVSDSVILLVITLLSAERPKLGSWFIRRPLRRTGPHTDAILIYQELPPLPSSRRITFLTDPS